MPEGPSSAPARPAPPAITPAAGRSKNGDHNGLRKAIMPIRSKGSCRLPRKREPGCGAGIAREIVHLRVDGARHRGDDPRANAGSPHDGAVAPAHAIVLDGEFDAAVGQPLQAYAYFAAGAGIGVFVSV